MKKEGLLERIYRGYRKMLIKRYFFSFATIFIFCLAMLSTASALTWTVNANLPEKNVTSFAIFNDTLYAGTGTNGIVYAYNKSTSLWAIAYDSNETNINVLYTFNNSLYAGASSHGIIYKKDGGNWTMEFDSNETGIISMVEWNNTLYAGSTPHGIIYALNLTGNASSWDIFNDTVEEDIKAMRVQNNSLFVGTAPNGKVLQYDGDVWSEPYLTLQRSVNAFSTYNDYLYGGTGDNGRVYFLNGTNWSAISWWNSSFAYREAINVTDISMNATDFALNLTLNLTRLANAGKLRTDCGDLRFTIYNYTSGLQTELSQWIENCTADNLAVFSKIYVKIPYFVNNTNTTIFMYYKNPSATNVSNKSDFLVYNQSTIMPYEDSLVQVQLPNTNYGYLSWVGIQQLDASGIQRVLVKYNLNFSNFAIKEVYYANASFYYNICWYLGSFLCGTGEGVLAKLVNSSWNESVVTWNNQPTYSALNQINLTLPLYNRWIAWNITTIAQMWFNGTINYGLELKFETEIGKSNHVAQFYSRHTNTSSSPKLYMNYSGVKTLNYLAVINEGAEQDFASITIPISLQTTEKEIMSLKQFRNFLFAGTSTDGYIYRFDGTNWAIDYHTNQSSILAMLAYNVSSNDERLFAGTSDYGIIYQGLPCQENWVVNSTPCGVHENPLCAGWNNKTLKYYDSNHCNTFYYIPEDNSTCLDCDYCSPAWYCTSFQSCVDYWKDCLAVDDAHYDTCCNITGYASDCNFTDTLDHYKAPCGRINTYMTVPQYPYVDCNTSYQITVRAEINGTPQHFDNLLITFNSINQTYNFTWNNATEVYETSFIFQTGNYPFTIWEDYPYGVMENITGTFLVRCPCYITVNGYTLQPTNATDPYKNIHAYVTMELISQRKTGMTGNRNPYDTQLEDFLTPLTFSHYPYSMFHAPYVNGQAVIKLWEVNETYGIRLFDGIATFPDGVLSKVNATKLYKTNIFLGTQKFECAGNNESFNYYFTEKELKPFTWLFNWIFLILILAVIVIAGFLLFMIPPFAMSFGIGGTVLLCILRIILWVTIG